MSTDNSVVITTNMISVSGAARLTRSEDYRDVVLDVATDGDTIDVIDGRLHVNPNVGVPDTIRFTFSDLKRSLKQVAGIYFVQYVFRFRTLRMFELLEQTPEGPIVVVPPKVMRSIDGNYTEIIWEFTLAEDAMNYEFKHKQWYILFGKTGDIILPDDPDTPDTPIEPEEPVISDVVYYGYILDGVTYRVSDITDDMILNSADTKKESIKTIDKVIFNVPTGSVFYIAVPTGYTAMKDDGVGNKIVFDENIGVAGTGANGRGISITKASYKLYGEFSLIDCEVTLYVIKDA